jgi:hypothetical protein
MTACFPDPYPDELLYSLCARYSNRARYPRRKVVVAELFGTSFALPAVDLPTRLDALVAALPPYGRWTVVFSDN